MVRSFFKIIVVIFVFSFFPLNVNACYNVVNVYLFHSKTCSHCQAEIEVLEDLEKKYSNLRLYKYEIHDENNYELYDKVVSIYKVKKVGVPFLIIGDKFFIGYNVDSSRLKFIKTIDYYSKYGYIDRVADLVGNEELPVCEVKDSQISVNSFLKKYGNYKIIGSVYSDSLDVQTVSVLTSLLSEINIINVIAAFILVYLVKKLVFYKRKIVSLIIYLFFYLLSNFLFMLDNMNISLIVCLLVVFISLFFFFKYKIKKNLYDLIYGFMFFLGVCVNIVKFGLGNKYMYIFSRVIELNRLSVLDIFIQYIINFFVVVLVFIFIFVIVNYICGFVIRKDNLFSK